MAKVVNVVGCGSNVGKTMLMEGLIKELKSRGYSIATIKHDVHDFDIDKKGKDAYKHRKEGSETVIISSKNRFAMIEEVTEEKELNNLLKMVENKDVVLVEGYKNSNLRKIEVYRDGFSKNIISDKKNIIAVASDVKLDITEVKVVNNKDYKVLCDLIEKEEKYNMENYQ